MQQLLIGLSNVNSAIAEAFLYQEGEQIGLGRVKVYIPTEPKLLTGEVLVGREVLNHKAKLITMDMQKRQTLIELY
jgi:hypothetical protein